MKCYKHGLQLLTLCGWCGKQICENCMPIKGRKYCENCITKLPGEFKTPLQAQKPEPPANKRHFVLRGDE